MDIDVTLLTTVAECDSTLEILQAEKTQLERRLRNLGETLSDRAETNVEIAEGIASVQSILSGYQAALGVITDEKEKRSLELKIEREETKLKSLQNREANYSAVATVEDQVDHEQLEVQIPVLTDAITQVETHKTTL